MLKSKIRFKSSNINSIFRHLRDAPNVKTVLNINNKCLRPFKVARFGQSLRLHQVCPKCNLDYVNR